MYLQSRLVINGVPKYYRMRTARSPSDDNHLIVAVENVDSTVRAKMVLQEALEKALDVAKRANKAKSEPLFNMSHDIRTPMNAITGFIALTKKNIENEEKNQKHP